MAADEAVGFIAIGAGLAVGLAGMGTGLAQKDIGAAAVGAITEDPKMLGKALMIPALPPVAGSTPAIIPIAM